jgi:hypothetical protein
MARMHTAHRIATGTHMPAVVQVANHALNQACPEFAIFPTLAQPRLG